MYSGVFRSRRRTLIVGTGLGALAAVLSACTTYGRRPAADAIDSPSGPEQLAKTADVPVGSGVIVDDIVITQPAAGTFTGLSSVCTHAGCHVSAIVDGAIVCPCHGSRFNLDGTVANGPATAPLEAKPVAVQGDAIVAAATRSS
ncbi:Cytochrome b6-f complex iron-sulfur subunit [Mycolicibacterium vanbaalenii]|uniref:Cytochrome bc1 complex Rieske iron-sulfur subunit n=1 Tax=Mycolicibacterium vanbaalenii TaxID=110539 RepID=A0A5S9PWX9_MYCVN|nr:Rieske (2Fe-2S) protein [Mycolicibacterium vanbaalenii]CAA0108933.1 Cytochrome b6-f complex iron-sulfur subunit [Mycolicibacterium vanbaalenii]